MGKFPIVLAVAVLSSSFTATAAAQSSTVTILDVARGASHGDRPPTEINYADCLTNDSVKIALELRGTEGFALQVWAGDQCDSKPNRAPAVTATCWQVYSVQPHDDLNTVELAVRDLLYGRTWAGVEPADSGASQGEPACELSSTATAPQVLTTYLMLVDANTDVRGFASWKFTYRLNASPPPTLDSVASGDRQLSATFSPDNTDQFLAGVQLFCDPAPSDPNATANAQAVTDDAGVFTPTCSPSAELVPGAPAATLQHLRCGSAAKGALTAVVPGLLNGVSYNIAVASVDTYGNVGLLSGVACQVPQERASRVNATACSFAGTSRDSRDRSGSALACVMALGAALWRRRLGRQQRRANLF